MSGSVSDGDILTPNIFLKASSFIQSQQHKHYKYNLSHCFFIWVAQTLPVLEFFLPMQGMAASMCVNTHILTADNCPGGSLVEVRLV